MDLSVKPVKKCPMEIIDLSLPIDDHAYEVHDVSIERVSHKDGIEKLNKVLMGKQPQGEARYLAGERIIKKENFPDEEFLSLEIVHCPVHIGTHLDYSFHYGSKSEGRPSKTADEIPLQWCRQKGVKIDLRHKKSSEVITDKDLEEGLAKMQYSIKSLDIVLLHTGADKLYGRQEYFSDYPGVDVTAIDYLLDRGVKIFGVDTMGIDRPYKFMMKEFLENGNSSVLWPAHFHGRRREFVHIERLANLERLPDYGFRVLCFPVRIRKTGAAWARVAGILEEDKNKR